MKASLRTITPQIPGVLTLRFDVSLKFRPGQAVQVTFPGDPKPRFYSISSAPTEGPYLEITIKNDVSSAAATIAALKRGDTVEIAGPSGGSLALPDPITQPLCFLAAGTGVTPFRSMIRYLIDQDCDQDFWLLHSVKTQAQLLFRGEFSQWSGLYKKFHYVPTLTQDSDDNWKNETGRITDTLLLKHIPSKPCTFLLCGPSSFVNDMEGTLKQVLGIPETNIRREKW